MASFNQTVIARAAAGLYDIRLGNASMSWAISEVNSSATYNGHVEALVQAVYATDFGSHSAAATALVTNLVEKQVSSLDPGLKTYLVGYVQSLLDGAGAGNEGATIVSLVNGFAGLTNHPNATIAAAATSFNVQVAAANTWAQTLGSIDQVVHAPAQQTTFFTILAEKTAPGSGSDQAIADVMRLTGNQDVRIDFTDPAHQITGLDLNGDQTIKADGQENSATYLEAHVDTIGANHSGFEIVDAYPRNPLDHTNTSDNFLGDIYFDGKAFDGDGVSTDGNIFLGGLGVDEAFGGVGNDFLAGGGLAQGRTGQDKLHGGRNADFFFAEFSDLDATDGSSLWVDGGTTADDTSAGNSQSAQDSDWLLFEATDDDEPVHIWLNDDNLGDQRDAADGLNDGMGRVLSRSGESLQVDDVENIDASGNLYGFLDNMEVKIGGRATDLRGDVANGSDDESNYGFGSTAQLWISGSNAANIVVAGYDNDYIEGRGGDDLLMGGRLDHLRDPNLPGIWNDGRDEIKGGDGNDGIVFETDGGIYEGGNTYGVDDNFETQIGVDGDGDPIYAEAGVDTLWLTNYTFGLKTATDVTSDGTIRIDLAVGKSGGLANAAGYGGADKNAASGQYTSDQTLYKAGFARAQVQDFENVVATGMDDSVAGVLDYVAAGSNDPELKFNNQQNLLALTNANLDIRGTDGDNVLYAVGGNDKIEGRGGDDLLSGGDGQDDFFFASWSQNPAATTGPYDTGDGIDVIHRQTDANHDNIWDGTYERDFGIGATGTSSSTLKIQIVKAGGNAANDQLTDVVNSVTQIVTGVKVGGAFQPITLNTADIQNATTYAGLTAAINTALDATAYGADLDAKLQPDGFTILITSKSGAELADQTSEVKNAGVSVSQKANTATANVFTTDLQTTNTPDRIIYVSYEDRQDNERTDDDSFNGSSISLGIDAYAEDRVVGYVVEDGKVSTHIAEDQQYLITFKNLTTEDVVSININGVVYKLQVGVDLDGNIVPEEDGIGDKQADIQTHFLARLSNFINTFMDDDTVVGAVDTAATATTLTVTQRVYNGEQTVFMNMPTVDVSQQQSGGEKWTASVVNTSQHELDLYQYDGHENGLNRDNVLFWGTTQINRSYLETAKKDGGPLTGSEAVVIDGGVNDLADKLSNGSKANEVLAANNTATNEVLAKNFAVHGDDLLMGGAGIDVITAGTGDDRVIGSLGSPVAPAIGTTTGAEVADGGKNFYAVKILGESTSRVYVLNKWEAVPANAATLADFAGLTISSITLIDQAEYGTVVEPTKSGVFDDTLQFQQNDFTVGKTNFTITLDDFTVDGNGVVQLKHDGAGLVMVDLDGSAATTTDRSYTRFTNFENIRTVSGTGNAVANDGQGNDTLDVSALSKATGGVRYNLTNNNQAPLAGGDIGSVYYSANKHANTTAQFLPTTDEYESLVLKVDGVENVIGGEGNDLLLIDESEAAKNNTFAGGLGADRIEYQNDFPGTTIGEASVTVFVNATVDFTTNAVTSAADSDVVRMTAGRVGSVIANDLLTSVETITVAGETAQSLREDDVIDVTRLTAGATVNYVDGKISDSAGVVQLQIENIVEFETVKADGNDRVIVANSATMNDNHRSDELNGTPSVDIQLATFLDFDTFKADGSRKVFSAQTGGPAGVPGEITQVINQNQFTFDLGTNGTDRVDYSHEAGRIVAVMNFTPNDPNKYVLVDGDQDAVTDTNILRDAGSRVDKLVSVEQIVASAGDSVIDLTNSGRDTNVIFSYNQPDQKADFIEGKHKEAALDRQINTVRVADAQNQNALGNVDLLEYRDLGAIANSVLPDQTTATWNSVQGSDFREYVQLTQWEADSHHTFTLRAGNNEVNYNERTDGIKLVINSVDTTVDGVAHQFSLGVNYLTSTGVDLGRFDNISGYNQANAIGVGGVQQKTSTPSSLNTMRIEASQGDQDFIDVSGFTASGVYLVGNIESSGSSVVTATFTDPTTGLATGSGLTMSGFEFLWDGTGNDTYVINDLSNFVSKLTLIDWGQPPEPADRDTVKLQNGSFETATIRPPINQPLTISNNLHMGDGDANDLQRLGLNSNTLKQPFGVGGSIGFDFQVLDISEVTNQTKITATGSLLGTADEIVVGGLTYLSTTGSAITNFDILSLTNASAGTSFDFDLDAGQLQDATNTKIVGFDADMGTLDLSRINDGRAITVTVTDLAGVGATVVGSAGVDTITGGNGSDVITGGAGADVLDGGFVAAVGATYTVTLSGVTATSGAAGSTMTIAGMTISTVASPAAATEIAPGADADQIGAKFAGQTKASWITALDAAGLTTAEAGSLDTVTYDPASNQLVFKFNTGAGATLINPNDVITLTAAPAVTGTAVLGAAESDTDFVPQADSSDTFVYKAASNSTAAAMDTIKNFNIDSGAGSIDDIINLTAIDADALTAGDQAFAGLLVNNTAAADYSAVATAAGAAFASNDIFVGRTATDAYVFVDADQSGTLTSVDLVIKLAGVTDVSGMTTAENFGL